MTHLFLLLGALAVAALGVWVRQRAHALGQILIVVGILGTIGCLVFQLRSTLFPPDAAGPDRGQAVVSYYLAEQVLAEVGDQQGPIVLFFPPASVIDEELVGTYAGTFARVLRSFPALKVETTSLDVPAKTAKTGQFDLAAFQKAAAKTPGAIAYVSFAGVPSDVEKFTAGGAPNAGFFVFDPWGTTNWLGALKAGRVRAAIVPRPGVPRAKGEVSGEPQELFQRLYLMASPTTVDEFLKQLKP